jgi:hypothetical protein
MSWLVLLSTLFFCENYRPVDAQVNAVLPVGGTVLESTTQPVSAEPNSVRKIEANAPPAIEPNIPEVRRPTEKSGEPNKPKPVAGQEPNAVEPNDAKSPLAALFHNKCAEILRTFVKEDGIVDYSNLKRRRLELKELLSEFDNLDPNQYNTWSREDKIALWINAYNVQMLNIITDNYPIKASRILSVLWGPYSIRHIKGIGTDYKFMVMDEEFTLAEVERRFSTADFNEPRVWFAISYASLSGPPLLNEPYYGYKLNEQLEKQTKRFLSSQQGIAIDRKKGVVYLSALFQSAWRGKEFVKKFGTDKKFKDQSPETRAVLNFISRYIPKEDASFLEVGNYSVEYIKYDWTVNDISNRP